MLHFYEVTQANQILKILIDFFFKLKSLRKLSLELPFFKNHKNLLYKIFYNYSYLQHVIALFGQIFFMRPYIMKQKRNFVCPFVNQAVYTLTFKLRDLQIRNFLQRYWRGFLRRPGSDFFKKWVQNFQNDFKKYFLGFQCIFFILRFFASLCGT